MRCADCGKECAGGAAVCPSCGKAPDGPQDGPPPVPSPDDFVGRMVPSGNKPALVAYYASILSLLPLAGLAFGVVAVVAGVRGVKLERRHPEVRGGIHAWFGLVLGGIMSFVWLVGAGFLVAAAMK